MVKQGRDSRNPVHLKISSEVREVNGITLVRHNPATVIVDDANQNLNAGQDNPSRGPTQAAKGQ